MVKRAWTKIFNGAVKCIESTVEAFLDKYRRYIYMAPEFELQEITGQRVMESFARTKDSAGSMDGWTPKEMSLLSAKVYDKIAIMLNQIEKGAKWPQSATHAKVGYLEKAGAVMGKVMSYRPLTITCPLYRCYATMRLEDLQGWIRSWALSEIHAGVPGVGAVDAWHLCADQN